MTFSTFLIIVLVVCNAAGLYCCTKAYDLAKPPKLDPYKDLDLKDLDELRQAVNDLDATAKKFRLKLYDLNKKLEVCK